MSSNIPTRVLAGVTVPDTPLINAAISLARKYLTDMGFNHVMRSFLFGFCISSKDPRQEKRDIEVHAISAILHDMGWALSSELVSKDKRFEVDGANVARQFLESEAPDWDHHRVQLVWDAIALHTTRSICMYKEVEVAACGTGILADFAGPLGSNGAMSWEEYDAIVKEYPRLNMADGVVEILCQICHQKPETTYDNLVGEVGVAFVEGYSAKGSQYELPQR